MRVLYVDDDRVNSLLFAELCRLAPVLEIELAGSASEAVDALARASADLLVLDLHLPDGDGLTLLPRLRQLAGRRLPAYLCSAEEPEQVQARAREAGFDGCWSKPLNVQAVLADLKRHAAGPAP
jgi:two-component system OmpR family response regulator